MTQVYNSFPVGPVGTMHPLSPGFAIAGVRIDNPSGMWLAIQSGADVFGYCRPHTSGMTATIPTSGIGSLTLAYIAAPDAGDASANVGGPIGFLVSDVSLGDSAGDPYTVAGSLASVDAHVTAVKTSVDALAPKIDAIKTSTDLIQSATNPKIDAVKASTDALAPKVDAIKTSTDLIQSATNPKIDAVKASTDALAPKIDAIKTSTDLIQSATNPKIDAVKTSADTIQTKVDAVKAQIDALKNGYGAGTALLTSAIGYAADGGGHIAIAAVVGKTIVVVGGTVYWDVTRNGEMLRGMLFVNITGGGGTRQFTGVLTPETPSLPILIPPGAGAASAPNTQITVAITAYLDSATTGAGLVLYYYLV